MQNQNSSDVDVPAPEATPSARPQITRSQLYELSGGDYVIWHDTDGKIHTDLPGNVPDYALSQFTVGDST